MTEHWSPGPWKVRVFADTVQVGPDSGKWRKSFWKTYEADARLIAAAPRLAASLRWLVDSRPHPTAECWAEAEAALKEAVDGR